MNPFSHKVATRSAALIMGLLALPGAAGAQDVAQSYQMAALGAELDKSCLILTLEGRTFADNLTTQVFNQSSSPQHYAAIGGMRDQVEAYAKPLQEAGCKAVFSDPQVVMSANWLNQSGLASAVALNDLPKNCQKLAAPYLEKNGATLRQTLIPATATPQQSAQMNAAITQTVTQWSDNCATTEKILNDDGSFNFGTTEWESTPMQALIRPYYLLNEGPEGATDVKTSFGYKAYRGLSGDQAVAMRDVRYARVDGHSLRLKLSAHPSGAIYLDVEPASDVISTVVMVQPEIRSDRKGASRRAVDWYELERVGDRFTLPKDRVDAVMGEERRPMLVIRDARGNAILHGSDKSYDERMMSGAIDLEDIIALRDWALAPSAQAVANP